MGDLLTDELVVVDVDLDLEPQCDSPSHESKPWWHGGDADFVIVIPCGHGGLRCRGLYESVMAYGGHTCARCGDVAWHPHIRFIEL